MASYPSTLEDAVQYLYSAVKPWVVFTTELQKDGIIVRPVGESKADDCTKIVVTVTKIEKSGISVSADVGRTQYTIWSPFEPRPELTFNTLIRVVLTPYLIPIAKDPSTYDYSESSFGPSISHENDYLYDPRWSLVKSL